MQHQSMELLLKQIVKFFYYDDGIAHLKEGERNKRILSNLAWQLDAMMTRDESGNVTFEEFVDLRCHLLAIDRECCVCVRDV